MGSPERKVVFMYHGIVQDLSSVPANREKGALLYDVPVQKFRDQMAFLKNNDYFVTTLEKESLLPQGKKVIFTFDDGELNNYTNAFPVLKQFDFLAYFFVTVNRIGQKDYMGWKELKALRDADMIVGSHGLTHEILTKLTTKQLVQELEESKRTLEDHLQVPVDYFSVPRGFYNKEVIDCAVSAGYKRIFISEKQAYFDDNCVSRTAVKHNWTIGNFYQVLEGEIALGESLFSFWKGAAKRLLGGRGYDALRSKILKK